MQRAQRTSTESLGDEVLQASTATLARIEAAYSDTKIKQGEYDDAAKEVEELQEQLEEAVKKKDKKGEKALTEELELKNETLRTLKSTLHDAKKVLAAARKRADAERAVAFSRIQSERLLHETAKCTRAYQDAGDEARRVLREAQLEKVRAMKRARAAAIGIQKDAHGRIIGFDPKAKNKHKAKQEFVAETSAGVKELKERLGQEYTRIAALFKSWDVDHDHSISRTELRQALTYLKIEHNEEDVDELFEEIDADASGTIDSEELHAALRSHGAPRKDQPGSVARLEMPKRREPAPNGNCAERRAIMALKRRLHTNLTRVKDLFCDFDYDGDGSISVKEVERALAGLCISIDRPAVKRLFAQIDTDGSGSIDQKELENMLKTNFEGDDIEYLAKYGPAKSSVKNLTRPQSAATTPAVRPQSRTSKRPQSAVGASLPTIGGHGGASLPRPASGPMRIAGKMGIDMGRS